MNTPSIIIWKKNWSVGVVDVDEDHKMLIKMINRLFGSTLSIDPQKVLLDVLAELTDYVVFHFNREEEYMSRLNYPDYAAHKQDHQRLLDAAGQFKQNLLSELPMDLKEVIENSLRDWLVTHIMDHDKRMGLFLNSQGIV